MASTRFTELVGCRLPIQQAGMTRVAGAELAAAVANAGGLGMIGLGRTPVDGLRATLDRIDALTEGPVGATFIVPFLRRELIGEVVPRLRLIEFFYGWPDPELVAAAPLVGWQVGSVDEACAAADAGCAYVVAQGVEAGGHSRGTEPLLGLVEAVRSAISVPLVAAGGIGTAAALRAAMAAGADAVRVGTRFAAAAESAAHPVYVQALIDATGADTVRTEAFEVGWPDAPHRVLASAIARAEATTADPVGEMDVPGQGLVAIPRFGSTPPNTATTGDIAAMALYAGMSVDAVHGVQSAAEIMAELTAGPSES
jgi:NAD(P)H-dependent flavin oxidoreductase YrpB (nitropropane dioxygenase family)